MCLTDFLPSSLQVIEFCRFHIEAAKKVDDKPTKSEEEIKAFDSEFVKVDQSTLFDLILVSSLLTPPLLLLSLTLSSPPGRQLPQHQGPPRSHLPDSRSDD
jgi:hypothetical protein